MAAGGGISSRTSSVASSEVVTLAKPSPASSIESACSPLRAPSSTTRTFWNSLITPQPSFVQGLQERRRGGFVALRRSGHPDDDPGEDIGPESRIGPLG